MTKYPEYYLGLDLSTQQLKAVVVEAVARSPEESQSSSRVVIVCKDEENVVFDRLGYGTNSGAVCKGPREIVAPTAMWVEALDILLDRLRSKVELDRVVCIGGCAQQHGTVYWADSAKLREMDPEKSLQENLAGAFSIEESPIWMDSSTTSQCRNMEAAVGGSQTLAELTGSRAYERFSGPQIVKIAEQKPLEYGLTERITLVSNFLSSLFIGDIAPIDVSDASGMNLMDITINSWSDRCLRACFARQSRDEQEVQAQALRKKLGGNAGLVPSGADLGPISGYMQRRFGFSSHCHVAAFTGDNPASFTSLSGGYRDMILSLGSSDTLLYWTEKDQPVCQQSHLMVNPLDPNRLMGMLCFKNGSLMRDKIAKELAEGDWERFNLLLDSTPPGNDGKVGLFFDFAEILPERQGRYRFDLSGPEPVTVEGPFAPGNEVRALIEGQMISKRLYIERLRGKQLGDDVAGQLVVTGGASTNRFICQIIADVFNMQVRTLHHSVSSAALGGVVLAYRCAKKILFEDNRGLFHMESEIVAEPKNSAVYDELLHRFKRCLANQDLL